MLIFVKYGGRQLPATAPFNLRRAQGSRQRRFFSIKKRDKVWNRLTRGGDRWLGLGLRTSLLHFTYKINLSANSGSSVRTQLTVSTKTLTSKRSRSPGSVKINMPSTMMTPLPSALHARHRQPPVDAREHRSRERKQAHPATKARNAGEERPRLLGSKTTG